MIFRNMYFSHIYLCCSLTLCVGLETPQASTHSVCTAVPKHSAFKHKTRRTALCLRVHCPFFTTRTIVQEPGTPGVKLPTSLLAPLLHWTTIPHLPQWTDRAIKQAIKAYTTHQLHRRLLTTYRVAQKSEPLFVRSSRSVFEAAIWVKSMYMIKS